jgi:iduronate 2-sulfatase
VTRVPLIMRVPTSKPGTSSSIVELVDLFPTACDATGLPIPQGVEGKSLLSVLENPKATVKEAAFSFVGKGTSMRTSNWAYMKYGDGSEELYEMKKDPKQFVNLAQSAEHAKVLASLRNKFQNARK